MNEDTDKHGLIGSIGTRVNQFINTAEPNLSSDLNELMNFYKVFEYIIVK